MPTSAHTYAARKAAKRCVFDGNEAQPGSVMCASCTAKQAAYRARQRTPAQQRQYELGRRMREANMRLLQSAPGASVPALLLCCGTWWQISHIPLPVPCCGRVWLEDRPSCGTGVE